MADIRNDMLKKGITAESTKQGKDLITKLENACGGHEKWKSYNSGSFTQTADWYENETQWTTNPQDYSMTVNLGTHNGTMTLNNGPQSGKSWAMKGGKSFAIQENGEESLEMNPMVLHKFPFKSYWFQFPFIIREAEFISYAGSREIEGKNYEAVFATWYSEEPNTRYDQFILYLNPENNQLEYLEFTVRDFNQYATGVARFTDYQESDGLTLPRSQFITKGTLDKPMGKLHENHYKSVSFK